MSRLKSLLARLSSYFPTPLPVGLTEFNRWQDSILALSKVPSNESTRFAIAVMVLHLGPTVDSKAKHYFVKSLNKSAANELANSVALDMKARQKARMEAEIQEVKTAMDIIEAKEASNESPGSKVSETSS